MPAFHLNRLLAILAAFISGLAIVLAVDPGRFEFQNVDAGGHALRMLIVGRGKPAVVFEAGGAPASGGALEAWNLIQPGISQITRTVTYDRAGIGWSPAGPKPRDARQVAVELHTALRNAGVPPPYLLVGHSFGGPLNRVFAAQYPGEVCGLVLVDPTQEEMIEWNRRHDTNFVERHDEEWEELMTSLKEAHTSLVPPGIPVVLITGMGPKKFPGFMSEEKVREYRDNHQLWQKYHQEWLDKIPGANHIIDENTGHDIPFVEPEIVITAISNVLAEVQVSPATPGKRAP